MSHSTDYAFTRFSSRPRFHSDPPKPHLLLRRALEREHRFPPILTRVPLETAKVKPVPSSTPDGVVVVKVHRPPLDLIDPIMIRGPSVDESIPPVGLLVSRVATEPEFRTRPIVVRRPVVGPPPSPDKVPLGMSIVMDMARIFDLRIARPILTQPVTPPFSLVIEEVTGVSDVTVCNIALAHLGQPPINALSDDNSQARRCARRFPSFRRDYFIRHPWNGITRTVTLNQISGTPTGPYDYQYALPTDFLVVDDVNPDIDTPGDDNWAVEMRGDGSEKVLLTDASSVVLRYVADRVEIGLLKPNILSSMGSSFAVALAPFFRIPPAEVQRLQILADRELADTRAVDSMEGSPQKFEESDLADHFRY